MELAKSNNRIGKKNQINQHLYVTKDMAQKLKYEADRNPAFNAICTNFAMRERSRRQLTLRNLYHTMVKEGFSYNKGDYARNLRFLNALGIGDLDIDHKGRLRSLKDITVALQVIALAALSKDPFEALAPVKAPEKVQVKDKIKITGMKDKATITITINNQDITVDMSTEEALKYMFLIMAEKRKV